MKVTIAYEDRITEDGRLIERGALWWDELPLPIMQFENVEWNRAVRVGMIVALEREEDVIWATMDIDLPSGFILSLDGSEAEIKYDPNADPAGPWTFTKMKIIAGTLIPIERWAWKGES